MSGLSKTGWSEAREEEAARVWMAAVDRAEQTNTDEDWVAADRAYRPYKALRRARFQT